MKEKALDTQWQERFTWFWFTEDEILRYTEEDFKRRAKELHDRGITVAINFSLTHFRFSYYKYWGIINAAFKKFVDACHELGIKVVEHHSASLVHNLLSRAGWGRFEDDLGSYSNWTATVDTWIDVPRYLVCDPKVDGKRLEDMFQVDGRTGKISDTVYHCHAFCYNNPLYREMYLKYMKDFLAEVPFDGMMNDDVQFFGDGNACTCEHCRRKFKERYGYELPQPDGWDAFFGDYSNPVYVAWERFKRESTEEWYRDLGKYYQELGIKLIRPNYCSDILISNITSYGFDKCCDVWNFIFQENCFSAIIKGSYVGFMAEAIHRYAAGVQNGVPSMSMFYPDREDTVYFAWSLAKAWGQLYTGTSEGVDTTGIEKKYRDFEKVHRNELSAPIKLEDVAFYFSMQTRDYTKDAGEKYMAPFVGSMQASWLSGLGVNMAFEADSVDGLLKHPCIVASHVALTTDEELSKFKEYIECGGKLIIMGDFGAFDGESKVRSSDKLLKALGVHANMKESTVRGDVTVCYDGQTIELSDMKAHACFENAENVIATAQDGSCVGIRVPMGEGELVWLSISTGESEFQPCLWSNRRQKNPPRVDADLSKRAYQLAHTGSLLKLFVKPKMQVSCSQDELLTSAYRVQDGLALHIVNISDTIPNKACQMGHEDVISNFMPGAEQLPEIKISVEKPDFAVKNVVLYTPERDEGIVLTYKAMDEHLYITVPKNVFSGYALISIHA